MDDLEYVRERLSELHEVVSCLRRDLQALKVSIAAQRGTVGLIGGASAGGVVGLLELVRFILVSG